jgi:hypothetical protein
VDGPLAVSRISAAILAEIEALGGFDSAFLTTVNDEARRLESARDSRLRDLGADLARLEKEIVNVTKFIRGGDDSQSVREDLRQLEREKAQLNYEKGALERTPTDAVALPAVEELQSVVRGALQLPAEGVEFGRQMRELTGRIDVYPFRSCDGGHPVLRAKFELQPANLLPDRRVREALRRPLARTLVVDLFEAPQRVAYRERVMALRQEMSEREAARKLGITIPAAQKAAGLDRLMKQLGLTDPYIFLANPPADYAKLRRHLHPRYHFDPLPDHHSDW